jgi:hypothetical protein
MHSPNVALAWQVWGRHRRGLAVVLLYLLTTAIVFNVLPAGTLEAQHGTLASIQFVIGLIYVAAVFAYGFETQLEAPQSGFPARQFTLPVRTAVLVGAPMLQGVALVALLWLAWDRFVLWPAGIEVPLLSTGLLAAAFVAVLQALLWSPFGLPWVRVVVAVVVLPLLALSPQFAPLLGLNATLLIVIYAVLIPLAALIAFVGVSRARHGEAANWSGLFRRGRSLARRPWSRAPFSSPERAQLWYECRRSLLPFPLAVAAFAVLYLAVVLGIERAPYELGQCIGLGLNLISFPLLGAMVMGGFLGHTGTLPQARYFLSSFTATRPLSVTALVAAKVKAAAPAALAAWAITWAALALWFLGSGSYEALLKTGTELFRPYPAWRVWATVLLAIIVPPLLTWRLLVENMWISLTGRPWLLRGAGVVCGLAMTLVALIVGRLMNDPQLAHELWVALPWWAGAAVLVKLLAAAWMARRLLRRGLVGPRTLAKFAAVWLLAAVGLFTLVRAAVLTDVVPVSLLASAVVLGLPLVRLGAAPLALAWNRHR